MYLSHKNQTKAQGLKQNVRTHHDIPRTNRIASAYFSGIRQEGRIGVFLFVEQVVQMKVYVQPFRRLISGLYVP